jgi:pimeloyl-ACP methyl ester carboxylesterase
MSTTVLLVHGAFADGSSWNNVLTRLQAAGVEAKAIPNQLRGLTNDGEYVKSVIAQTDGDVVLVGHSYGGAVNSYAGSGQANVKAIVFVSALALDKGESGQGVQAAFPDPPLLSAVQPWTYPGSDVPELSIKVEDYHRVFAADWSDADAALGAANQRPLSLVGLTETLSIEPAWKGVPTWWVFGSEDGGINPEYQRAAAKKIGATLTEVPGGSHTMLVSRSDEVAKVIMEAVSSVG